MSGPWRRLRRALAGVYFSSALLLPAGWLARQTARTRRALPAAAPMNRRRRWNAEDRQELQQQRDLNAVTFCSARGQANHAARSASGNSSTLPERGGHSMVKVFLSSPTVEVGSIAPNQDLLPLAIVTGRAR